MILGMKFAHLELFVNKPFIDKIKITAPKTKIKGFAFSASIISFIVSI